MPAAFRSDAVLPALAATAPVSQTDADDLAHVADHGWLPMEQTIAPELADAWVNDVHARHQTPGSPIR